MRAKDMYPALFSRHAADYERRMEQIMARGEARGRQRVVDLIDVQPGMHVLDLACGPGTLSRRLAVLVAPEGDVVGVDLATGMIDQARALAIPNARFEVMDIEQLDFPDRSFDAALCGHGMQFVPHVERALAEAHRVLRPRSKFAASVPVTAPSRAVSTLLDPVVDRWLPAAPRVVDQSATKATVSDPLAFSHAALAAGFSSARVEVIDETVSWESAEQLVSLFASWWDCAARLDGADSARQQAFMEDALATVKRDHPGSIETTNRNHVLFAVA